MTDLIQYRDGLWLAELSLPEFDVRSALVRGRDRCVIWDTLAGPADMRPVTALVEATGCSVVYSHADWDHVWGTGAVPRPQWVVAHHRCLTRFGDDVPKTLRQKLAAEPDRWTNVELVPPTLTFQSELRLELGGLGLTLHHLPGHTLDCIVAFVPEWGLLLAGDAVESPFPVVNPESPLPVWIEQLRRWARLPGLKTVVPSHGPVSDRGLIEANIEYLEGLLHGAESPPSSHLPDFYRETHRANVAIAQRHLRGG